VEVQKVGEPCSSVLTTTPRRRGGGRSVMDSGADDVNQFDRASRSHAPEHRARAGAAVVGRAAAMFKRRRAGVFCRKTFVSMLPPTTTAVARVSGEAAARRRWAQKYRLDGTAAAWLWRACGHSGGSHLHRIGDLQSCLVSSRLASII
jgi:hypothetical protein